MATIFVAITIIFALAWCVAGLLHRTSAALRHLVWTCAFAAVLLFAPLRWRAPHRVIAPALPSFPAMAAIAGSAPPVRGNPVDLSEILFGVWALGTVILATRLARNSVRLRSIMSGARGSGPIRMSSLVPGPLVAGVVRPVILLPDGADTWSRLRRRAVLAHETAHIRRRDPAILLAANIVTAAYWFHPLCWLALARLRAESERACDDAALRTGVRPSGYATDLLELARMFDTQLAIPMATTSHLESRVKSILDPLTNRSFPARATWFAAIAITAVVLAPLTTFTLRAQPVSGTAIISGVVTDPTGAVIPNVMVTAINAEAGYRETTAANSVGSYTFNGMPAGIYTIEAQAPGFAAFRSENLAVVPGATLKADAHLTVASAVFRSVITYQGTAKPQASAPAAPTGPIRVGGNVQPPRLIFKLDPVYPGDLQAQGIEGTVILAVVISKDGMPKSVQVLKSQGSAEFAPAAIDAARQWRYKPAMLNGEPTEVLSQVEIDFKLSAAVPVIDDRVIQ